MIVKSFLFILMVVNFIFLVFIRIKLYDKGEDEEFQMVDFFLFDGSGFFFVIFYVEDLQGFEDNLNVFKLLYLKLFWFFFYNFGFFVWGGFVVQIVLIKEKFVI